MKKFLSVLVVVVGFALTSASSVKAAGLDIVKGDIIAAFFLLEASVFENQKDLLDDTTSSSLQTPDEDYKTLALIADDLAICYEIATAFPAFSGFIKPLLMDALNNANSLDFSGNSLTFCIIALKQGIADAP